VWCFSFSVPWYFWIQVSFCIYNRVIAAAWSCSTMFCHLIDLCCCSLSNPCYLVFLCYLHLLLVAVFQRHIYLVITCSWNTLIYSVFCDLLFMCIWSHPFTWLPHGKNWEILTWYVKVNVHSGKTTRSTGSSEFQFK